MSNISHHVCACGNPAIKRINSGFVCERCRRLEAHHHATKNKGTVNQQKRKTYFETMYSKYVEPYVIHLKF